MLGRPKLIVAPMVDNSELPFRSLCRKYGAEAAYTPMLHSRMFSENEKYRSQEFTTCKEDRPLFVQFCANNPDLLLEAARRVEAYCDYVDINFGLYNLWKQGFHCVPVIISDEIELPYEDIHDYSEFCIFVSTSDDHREIFLIKLIRGICKEEWRNVEKAQRS
ncbi:hypothetical protein ACS0TY_001402 [Phlomoides rotata]